MNFGFSEEQEEFRATLARFFEEKSPIAEVFRLQETPEGFDRGLWKQMAAELGLQGVHLPEALGGQGFGFLELGIVMEEMGRLLLPSPYFSTVCLAAAAIVNAGTDAQQKEWLPAIASGDCVATLALLDEGNAWTGDAVRLAWDRDGDGYRLSGRKRLVTDGGCADLIVVAARRPGSEGADGLTLFVVRGDAAGLSRTGHETLDLTRKLADLELDGVGADLLGSEGAGADALARTLDQARVALALESAGGAERCLNDAVAYAKQRIQFGRPIGSFQAIKHTCASLLLEVESAKSLAYWAGWVAAGDSDELALAAATAKSMCDETFLKAADDNVHIHGGIGVTWEAAPHLFLKRARSTETLLGSPAWLRERIAALEGF